MYGHAFGDGMRDNQRLPRTIITPTTKGEHGEHDAPLSGADVVSRRLLTQDSGTRFPRSRWRFSTAAGRLRIHAASFWSIPSMNSASTTAAISFSPTKSIRPTPAAIGSRTVTRRGSKRASCPTRSTRTSFAAGSRRVAIPTGIPSRRFPKRSSCRPPPSISTCMKRSPARSSPCRTCRCRRCSGCGAISPDISRTRIRSSMSSDSRSMRAVPRQGLRERDGADGEPGQRGNQRDTSRRHLAPKRNCFKRNHSLTVTLRCEPRLRRASKGDGHRAVRRDSHSDVCFSSNSGVKRTWPVGDTRRRCTVANCLPPDQARKAAGRIYSFSRMDSGKVHPVRQPCMDKRDHAESGTIINR